MEKIWEQRKISYTTVHSAAIIYHLFLKNYSFVLSHKKHLSHKKTNCEHRSGHNLPPWFQTKLVFLFLCLKAVIVTNLKPICTIQVQDKRSNEIFSWSQYHWHFTLNVWKRSFWKLNSAICRLPHFSWLQGGEQTYLHNLYKWCKQ